MFSRPAKMLIIAMNTKNEPMWGASVVPEEIRMNYDGPRTDIDITGVLLDGPTPIAELIKELDGFV